MSGSATARDDGRGALSVAGLRILVGSGDKIGAFVLPFLVLGIGLNVWRPELFRIGGPSDGLRLTSWAVLAVGVVMWAWTVYLILTRVPRAQLITTGPFALVKHPLYTGVSMLVLPWAGLLLNTWIGLALGLVLYFAARRYAPAEERALAREFGNEWDEYEASVKMPWL